MPAINYRELHLAANVATAFRNAASNFATRGKNLKTDIQSAALSALAHMEAHGDYSSTALVLMEATKTALGKNMAVALGQWFIAFSWLGSVDGKTLTKMKDKTINIEAAEKVNFWEMERETAAKPFDAYAKFDTYLEAVVKEAAKDGSTVSIADVANYGTGKLIEAGKLSKQDMIERLFTGLDIDSKNDVLALLTQEVQSFVAETVAEGEAEAIAA